VKPSLAESPRRALTAIALAVCGLLGPGAARAQSAPGTPEAAEATSAPVVNSALDALLFYQLLIGELEMRGGKPDNAYQLILDAARRTRDEQLFRRAVDIALQARAGDDALAATRAWRTSVPESVDAVRMQLQILAALNRLPETAEPLRTLIARTPEASRSALIASLPRFFQRASDPRAAVTLLEQVLQPYADAKATRTAVRTTLGRATLAAGDTGRALALATEAHADEPTAPGPVLLAIDLMPQQREAEAVVLSHLRQPGAEPGMRLAYVRALTQAQRYADAITQLDLVTRQQPELPSPWLTLGALHLELRHAVQAEAALQRYVQLAPRSSTESTADTDSDGEDDGASSPNAGLVQAWLLLAQAAEMRGDFPAAEAYLARVDSPQRALEVQTRRATILARQGKLPEARELIRRLPEPSPEEARAKLLAEAQVMRDVKQWQEAYRVLEQASQRFADDTELLYEQAMMAEKLERMDQMERLLRRVIELKPDNQNAYNALGYSLADRSERLPEARALIRKALDLAPGDPFITDSLGWVEYRLGNRDEALKLLRQAYATRPDTEIAAHLGEVLWVMGQRDEALRVWREGKSRDSANDVLRETLARLKPDL
jgi:Flp pilus assembly protein TadD